MAEVTDEKRRLERVALPPEPRNPDVLRLLHDHGNAVLDRLVQDGVHIATGAAILFGFALLVIALVFAAGGAASPPAVMAVALAAGAALLCSWILCHGQEPVLTEADLVARGDCGSVERLGERNLVTMLHVFRRQSALNKRNGALLRAAARLLVASALALAAAALSIGPAP